MSDPSPKTSEIWYRTSDNQPITNIIGSYPDIISNEYVKENDCCILKFDNELTKINQLFSDNKLTEILYLPSTLKTIGDSFLNDCRSLIKINLDNLINVTTIGCNFLKNNIKLLEIDLTAFKNVTNIAYGFLNDCKILENIDLSPLQSLTTITNWWFSGCNELKNINLSKLDKITEIGNNFLIYCDKIEEIDLSEMVNLETIGSSFNQLDSGGTSSVKKINLNNLQKLRYIDKNFCLNCSKLENINITNLLSLTRINNGFLNGTAIKTIDLTQLKNIGSLGDHFLAYCSRLEFLDFSPFNKLTYIDGGTMLRNDDIATIFIDHPNDLITLPLKAIFSGTQIKNIYVNDELLEEYKVAVPRFAEVFKPLSEYNL